VGREHPEPATGMSRPQAPGLPVGLALGLAAVLWVPAPLASQSCTPLSEPTALPAGVVESSGAALSRYYPGLLWTHNDGGHPAALFAVDRKGAPMGSPALPDTRNVDWEDMETAACQAGNCLYLADTGDNAARRDHIVIYRVPEPDPSATHTQPPMQIRGRFPAGARDVEALFVLPPERPFLVTKGSHGGVEVYRFPNDARFSRPEGTGGAVDGLSPIRDLELVQVLDPSRRSLPRQVTGASASPAGDQVVLRTYETLEFFHVVNERLIPMPEGQINLRPFREGQGEGVAWGLDDQIALTSEAGPFGPAASFVLLACTTPPPP
jgi:hypothetical protein